MALLNFLRDVFDANTEEDQRKRLAREEERYYKDQQKARGNKRPAENLAEQVAGHTLRFLNTAAAGARGAAGLADVARASVLGDDEDYKRTVTKVSERMDKDLNPDSGLFGAGTLFDDARQAENISPLQLARKTVGGALGVGSEVVPGGRVAKGATLAQRAGRGVVEGVVGGAAGNLGSQLVEGGDISVGDVAKGAAFGGVVGGATPIAIAAGKDIAKTSKQIGADERGSIGAGEAVAPATGTPAAKPEKKLSFIEPVTPAEGERQHGIYNTIQNKSELADSAKQANRAIEPQTYKQMGIDQTLETARKAAESNVDQAKRVVDTGIEGGRWDAETSSHAIALLEKYAREGADDNFAELSAKIAPLATASGQANVLWRALSVKTPDKMVDFAKKVIDKANEEQGFLTKTVRKVQGKDAKYTLDPETEKFIREQSQKAAKLPDGDEKDAIYKGIMDAINDRVPPGASEIFDAYRYQNLLSNPRTQLRNTASNLFQAMVTRPATLASRASTDWFGATLFGKDRQYYAKEVPTYYKGLFNSIGDAIEASKKAWSGELPISNPDLSTIRALRNQDIPKKYTVVSRFMEAQDRFFITLIASGEYAAQKAKGVSDEVAEKEANRVAQYSLFRQDFDPRNATGQGTLLSGIDKVSDTVTKFGAKHKAFRWFVPFVRTPMNATKQMVEYSPLGFATLPGANNKTEQLSKAMAGSMLAMIGAKLALDGETTWDAPKDETERQLFYESGKRPYSIKIGDKWVPMIYFGPYSLAFALPAAAKSANDRAPIDATTEEKLGAAIQNSLKYFSQQTYVQGIANIVDLVSGQSAGGSKNLGAALGFTAGQAIPLQGLLRYVAGVFDPTIRQSSNFLESIQAGIPGMSQGLEPYQTLAGNESRRNITDYVAPYTLGLPPGGEDNQRVMKANSDFLRTLRKTSRPRTRANEEINKAIQENDMEKAYKIARDYNESLKQAFSGWREKYGDQATNADLVKQYRDQKIRLNRSSIAQRRYTQKAKSKYQRSLVNA